jgi:Transposase
MALSMDIREKVMKAIAGGMSRRQAATRFDIGPATAVRWAKRVETSGSVAPSKMGVDRRSQRIEAHSDFIRAQIKEQPDLAIMELREKIQGAPRRRLRLWNGVAVSGAAQDHAQEEDGPCVRAGKRGCRRRPRGVVRGTARSRSLEARVH